MADVADEELPDAVYQYTYDVLSALHADGLMPTFVQVGQRDQFRAVEA